MAVKGQNIPKMYTYIYYILYYDGLKKIDSWKPLTPPRTAKSYQESISGTRTGGADSTDELLVLKWEEEEEQQQQGALGSDTRRSAGCGLIITCPRLGVTLPGEDPFFILQVHYRIW